jgi:dipeptidyl aminopeptidase/acylaminoacyl peptidase
MRVSIGLLVVLTPLAPAWGAGRPMERADLLAVKTVSDPQLSPDGKQLVYVVSVIDAAANKSNSDLWTVPVAGGEAKRLTTSPGGDNHPRFSPDGQTIAFVSDRSGSAQIWLLPVNGGEARQLTKLPIDVAGPIWSPTGDRIAFAAEVYPNASPAETAAKDKQKAESKTKARSFDQLMIRHWTAWDDGKRSHIFVCDAKSGEAKDLTTSLTVNSPPAPFGGSNDYTFTPDGQGVLFTAEPVKDTAWSTKTNLNLVEIATGKISPFSGDGEAALAQPSFSPNGESMAYVSQARAGFESDLWVLKIKPWKKAGATLATGGGMDRPIQSYSWSDDSKSLVAVIDDGGTEPVVRLKPGQTTPAGGDRLIEGGVNAWAKVPPDGREVVLHNSTNHPAELYRIDSPGSPLVALTHHNDSLVSELDLSKAEGFTFKGADGDPVSGWLIRPPGFDPSKKYPVLFLIHGGPQGAWHDEWHARWNYPLFAAPGYAVIAINPRGSTGYGQKFTDQISKDWTGRVYKDLMSGLDFALKTYPFLDESRMAAAGGSYGGFMVNWIAGHTDRFKALISHAGVFDLASKYGTTEELWFPEWEFGGAPWDKPEVYRDQSPSTYVQNMKTPMLITHGALDFRVSEGQGMGLFTALQRRGVRSRYVLFPDEGHWILKPGNRLEWWTEMHQWLAKYLKPESSR